MTDAEREAIVARAMNRHLAGAFASEHDMRAMAEEIRQGFEARGATADELEHFISDFVSNILGTPTTDEERRAAIRAMSDGFKVDVVPVKVKDGIAISVRQRIRH